MAKLYDILGVSSSANEEEIRSAYRKLAKKHHPDLAGSGGDDERFKEISAAYSILSDPEKRARYDRGEIDEAGQERPDRAFYRQYRDFTQAGEAPGFGFGGGGGGPGAGAQGGIDLDEILSNLFGGGGPGGGGGRGRAQGGGVFGQRGEDARASITVSFVEAAKGGTRTLRLSDGRTLEVRLPEGTANEQVLRLKGQGGQGFAGGEAGDLLVTVKVAEHPFFVRDGADIHLEVPITLKEAVEGGRVTVPTLHGPVALQVPAGSQTGSRLRLKGKGLKDPKTGSVGHQIVRFKVVLPAKPDKALQDFVASWTPADGADPRAAFKDFV